MFVLLIFGLKLNQSMFFVFFFFFLQRKMQGSCMSEHNMRTMKIKCMQLAEQKHAK